MAYMQVLYSDLQPLGDDQASSWPMQVMIQDQQRVEVLGEAVLHTRKDKSTRRLLKGVHDQRCYLH